MARAAQMWWCIDSIFYTIAQQEAQVDLDWLLVALSRFEEGWVRQGNTLFSPNPSKLSQRQIIETLGAANQISLALRLMARRTA